LFKQCINTPKYLTRKMSSNKMGNIQKTVQQLNLIVESLQLENSALIDFDLSLEKTRQLYEELTDLKLEKLSKKNSSVEPSTFKIEKEPIIEEDLSDAIDQEALKYIEEKEYIDLEITLKEAKSQEPSISHEDVEKETIVLEEPEEENIEFIDEPSHSEKKKSPIIEKPLNDTIADQFEDKTSLNDILANIKNDDDFATQLQNRPIKDLKNAISLNDKIWFTRELFDGNNDNYLTSLEILNNAGSLEKAIEVANTYGWSKEESATKRFLELIYRRYV